jgi:hypothetical protein
MDLPSKESTFDFEHTGEDTGKEYKGRFTVKCVLNIGEKHSLALEKTRLMGNYAMPTDDLAGLAIILATIRAKVIDAPEWYKQSNGGAQLDDESVLVTLYQKIEAVGAEWKANLKKKGEAVPDQSQPLKP